MFDSQKLAFDTFALGYKHGIYVFTEDACHICQDYKATIEHINNANLYFVEVVTKEQKELVRALTDRIAFPLTACFKDNELQYVRVGQLFDLQLQEIFESLKEFGDKPLPPEEIQKRMKSYETRCKLTYYILPPNCDFKTRMALQEKAIKYNELPIDVDMLAPKLSLDEREHMLEGNYSYANLVVYMYDDTKSFTDLGQRVLVKYTEHNKNNQFITRSINEVLGVNNATDNSNAK